jgi:hypothetical protein
LILPFMFPFVYNVSITKAFEFTRSYIVAN